MSLYLSVLFPLPIIQAVRQEGILYSRGSQFSQNKNRHMGAIAIGMSETILLQL